jgi:two-component system sensor histidine kinase/response regulator
MGVILFPYYYENGVRTSDQSMPFGQGLTSQILSTGKPLLLNHEIEAFEARTGVYQIGTRVKSYLGVPIMVAQQAIGVISVQSSESEGRFSDDDLRLLTTIAANVGIAIENARLYREARRRAQETAALAEVGQEISASLDLPIVLERIAARALELLNGRDVALRLLEPDGRLPAVVTLGKYAPIYQSWDVVLGQGMTGHIAQSGIAEILNDPVNDPRVAPVSGTEPDDPTEAIIFAPLLVGKTVIGVLTVWRDKTISGPFVQSDLDFVVGLARHAAIAIANARLFAEIKRQKQFSDALIEASPVAIIQEDLREHVTSWNPAAEALFGYTPAEAVGQHLDDLVANRPEIRQDADRYTRITHPYLGRDTETAHGIGRRTRKDGQLVDVEFFGVPVIVDDQEVAGINLYHDITELQRARQEAIAANLAKSTFLANMSHELRTPLNAILGFTQVLERDPALTSRQREHLEIISRSGEHLLGLINDVLEVSKIEAGRLTLHTAPFDLPALFHNIIELFRLSASTKRLDLIAEVATDLPQYVYGDESKLRQVLINLLGNAVKFTATGGVTLRAAYQGAETPSLLVEVADTGEGIAEEQISRLFEAFSQTDSGLHAQESSGLGLAISRQYVQLMGGDIGVTSRLGEGSVFRFTILLPLADAQEPRRAAERRVIELADNQREYRLLVVDDKWESRKLLVTWLADVGFAVREAANGEEAIAVWEEWSPQLIWMDVRMPVLDGYEATRQIKATLKGQATVIIALTASAFDHERAIVLSAGYDDFVRKPVRESVIFAKLAEHLGVQFVYADSTPALTATQPSSSAADAVAAMPAPWIAAMRKAVSVADMDEIRMLTEQIQGQNATLAAHLGWLSDHFQIDQLLRLLQEAE